MSSAADRLPRIAAFSELRIPSAILGVDQIFEFLAATGICEFRASSSLEFRPEDLAWADSIILVRGASQQESRIQKEALRLGKRTAIYLDDDLENVPSTASSALFFHTATAQKGLLSILKGADLRDTVLTRVNLTGAKADDETVWPDGFDPGAAGVIFE